MQNINNYQSHVAISKELIMNDDFINFRADYKDDFEKIRLEAKDEKIDMSNAKDFLNSLSSDELSTLQHYSGLADEINIGKLNNEGAYNLLLHHYEKYDFNNDGIVSDGIARTNTLIPTNMQDSDKKALVKTLNSMDQKDSFLTLAFLNPPKLSVINGEIVSSINNEPLTYEKIMDRVNQIINPIPPAYSSSEIKNTFSIFKELFEKNHNEIEEKSKNIQNELSNNYHIIKAKLQS